MDTERGMWQDLVLVRGKDDQLWEVFHENSKLTVFSSAPSNEEVLAKMSTLHESLQYEGYPVIELPPPLMNCQASLWQAIRSRASEPQMVPIRLPLQSLATVLYSAYGISRDNQDSSYTRPFRTVPSAGALYPLELFFYTTCTDGLDAGLYHYNASTHHVQLLRVGEGIQAVARSVIGPNVSAVLNASVVIFLTAIFERAVFKYGDRGYRFVLLEAGHVAQNINLTSVALGLGSLNMGGYFDRRVDDFLEIDGVTHSAIYLVCLGGSAAKTEHQKDVRG